MRMTIDEAILDHNRPLNISPSDWIEHLKLIEETIEQNSIFTEELEKYEESEDDENALVYLDSGVDLVVQGIEIIMKGIKLANRADLRPVERKRIKTIEENVNHALIPYTSEIIDDIEHICDGD